MKQYGLRLWMMVGTSVLSLLTAVSSAQDTIPPDLTIVSPTHNDRVGGHAPFTVTATDNVGVSEVQFFKNGSLLGSDASAPYSMDVDFNADLPDADYILEVRAKDAAGNTAKKEITVNKPRHDFRPPGANLADNGGFFKVWAPHASSVSIMGDFNQWNRFAHYLWRSGDWWYGFQPGLQPSQKYKYVINHTLERPDPWARQMEHSAGASVIVDPAFHWTDGAWKTPAFEDMIIYELHLGTFIGKNDGQPYPGNFNSLLTKLDYIKSTGANMIELLPLHEVPGPDGNTPYLGYAPTGLFAVESGYNSSSGSAYRDLKTFVNAAHAKGLGVIVDVVYNHFSDSGGRDNWYWNYDAGHENGDGGIFFAGQFTDWGVAPDWGRQEVRQYIEQNSKYWLREFHVDGLRWDATTSITNKNNGWNAMRDILWEVRKEFPDKILIAEHLPYSRDVVESGNFHSGWWADFHHRVEDAFKRADQADLNAVKAGINGGDYSHVTKRVIYAMSHDEARNGSAYLISEFGGRGNWDARAKARAAATLMFMSPGIPMIWQGEEFAQDGWFNDDFDHAPNWHYENDSDGSKMKRLYQDATQRRWSYNALRKGSLTWTHEDNNNKVLAFRRDDGNQSILVVVNFSPTSFGPFNYGVSTGGKQGQWSQILCSQDTAYGGWDQAGNAYHEPWTGGDGKIYLSVPKFSVTAMRLK